MANGAVPRPRNPSPVSARQAIDPANPRAHRAVAVGDVINGKYLVQSFIGEGGVGIVAAAQNLELDERVALKFLRPEMLVQTDIVSRFLREAKAASSIKSEYVASVYDVGTTEDGAPFLVMEHLEGKDLGKLTAERGRFGHREATEYIMQTCEALAVAHSKGVVHRDIKPENLFLTSRAGMSVVKVLDFGISKTALTGSIFGNALPLVKTVSLMGTPLYMSPEQVRSADGADTRSDIWSLGMVLYELLTGTLPYSAPTITELCAAILESPMVSITNYRDDLPAGYIEVLERCIEKDPNKRFQNVAEMAIAFMPFAPKRARICAERAAQALRAAGLVEESSVRFLSTMPPPASTTNPALKLGTNPGITSPSVQFAPAISGAHPLHSQNDSGSVPSLPSIPGTPLLPSGSLAVPLAASSAPALSGASASSLHVAQAADTDHAKSRNRTPVIIMAFVAVAAVAAAVTAITFSRLGDPKGSAGSATNTGVAAAAEAATPKVAVPQEPVAQTIATNHPLVGSAAAPVALVPAAKKPGGPVFTWPPATPSSKGATPAGAAKAAAAPAANAPKKSAEEPDLGY